MKHTRTVRSTAYFMLATGIINLLMWLFLIASGQVEDLADEPIAFIFHWISELGTALLLITAGIRIFSKKTSNLNLMFLALGSLLMAIGGAFYYYIFHFDAAIFIFSAIITGATVIFILFNYQGLRNLIFITAGIILYGMINVMGQGFQESNASLISMSVPSTLFLLILITGLLGKEIHFDMPVSTAKKPSGATGKTNNKN